MRKKNNRIAAFELVDRAIRLQLSDDEGELSEIEDCLQRALSLDPNSIEVLQEAAHVYDAVVPNARTARKLAAHCRDKAIKLVAEMNGIIKERS
jgi:hypothetical protein